MRLKSLLMVFASTCLFTPASAKERRVYKPYVVLAGVHSRIDTPEYHRVANQNDFAVLWRRHLGEDRKHLRAIDQAAVPVIDFQRCMVVAVFAGRTTSSRGVYPHLIADGLKDDIRLRYIVRTLQPGSESEEATPFGVFVVERWRKPIILEEGEAPPVGRSRWERRAEFPALEE